MDIHSGLAVASPSLLSRFVIISFADLKKHEYLYWVGIPALVAQIPFSSIGSPVLVKDFFSGAHRMDCVFVSCEME